MKEYVKYIIWMSVLRNLRFLKRGYFIYDLEIDLWLLEVGWRGMGIVLKEKYKGVLWLWYIVFLVWWVENEVVCVLKYKLISI